MKKLFVSLVVFFLFAIKASAESVDLNFVERTTEYLNFRSVEMYDNISYITDKEYNILLGPFERIYSEDYSSYVLCRNSDGSEILYNADLEELASVPPEGHIFIPENGMYGLSRTSKSTDQIRDFQLFDLKTNEMLSQPGYFVYFYLEEQDEKMTIVKDGKYAIINKHGEYLTDFIFDEIKQRFSYRDMFVQPYMIVIQDGEEKYMDWELNFFDPDNFNGEYFITSSFKMDSLYGRQSDLRFVFSKEKQSIYNSAIDKLLVPFDAGYIFRYHYTDGVTFTGENADGLWGLMDNDGNVVLDFEYENISHTPIPDIVRVNETDGTGGYYNLVRKAYIPEFAGDIADDGLVILTEYEKRHIMGAPMGDKYTEKVPVSSQILNFAGHNVMGKEYKYVTCENSVFMEDTDGDRKGDTVIDVNRNFAIINLNGKYLDFDGVIADDRTLVPVREITEGLGGEVLWDEENLSARIFIDGREIIFTIESDNMMVNAESVLLDVPAKLINGKTMVPLRKLAEVLGADVDWDGSMKCVYIEK